MAAIHRVIRLKNLDVTKLCFSTSSTVSNKWRRSLGLEPNPRQYSPLTQLPDYSFLDGKPVPLSKTKYNNLKHQEELCQRIVELSHELDVGLEMYHERKKQEKLNRETIIQNKLKPKGAALLRKNKKGSQS